MVLMIPDKKFAFVHIPRTGGSSIEHYLAEYSDRYDPDYLPPSEKEQWDERYQGWRSKLHHYGIHSEIVADYPGCKNPWIVMAVVREPMDRLVSLYRNYVKEKTISPDSVDLTRFMELIQTGGIRSYQYGWLTQPQASWIKNGKRYVVNRFVRFENLEEDFKRVLKEAGLPTDKPLGKFNQSDPGIKTIVKEEDKDRLAKMVIDYYAEDYDLLYNLEYYQSLYELRVDHHIGNL